MTLLVLACSSVLPSMLTSHSGAGVLGEPLICVMALVALSDLWLVTHAVGVEPASAALSTASRLEVASAAIDTEQTFSVEVPLLMISARGLLTLSLKLLSANHCSRPPLGTGGVAVKPAPASPRTASW